MATKNSSGPFQAIGPFTTPFEINFNSKITRQWTLQNWTFSWYCIGAYLLFVILGQRYMKNKPRYEMRTSLIAWNALLAIFSLAGAINTVPEVIYTYRKGGFHATVCVNNFEREFNVPLFWIFIFCCSKIPELIDTLFIVFRKQKLIVLHWYHHAAVVVYAFFTYGDHPGYIRWFVSMNYSIHAIMYSYYALRALRVNIPKGIAMLVTILQILQMFIGSAVCVYAFVVKSKGIYCDATMQSVVACAFLYFSFSILFVNFFVKSYFGKPKQPLDIKKKK